MLYNLVNSPLWTSSTTNPNVAQIVMQNDGNLVMKDTGNQQIWATNTNGNPGAYLIVQNDGNIAVYTTAGVILWTQPDKIAPITTISGITEGGIYDNNVTIALSATDNQGGSGINQTYYNVIVCTISVPGGGGSGDCGSGGNQSYTTPFIVSDNGLYTITFWSIDNAGNIEPHKTVNFTISGNGESGTWYQGSGGISLTVGQTSIINMNSLKFVSGAYIKVGCNDGETMDGYIEYLDGSNWRIAQYFTGAGCGYNISFPQVATNSLRLTMTGGGGVDNKISWYSAGSNGWKVYAKDIIGQTLSAIRIIDNAPIIVCGEKNITVTIKNDNTQRSLSLNESIPLGWSATRISDDADVVRAGEWVWFTLASNAVKIVKYKLTVPYNTKPETYRVNGYITTSNGGMTNVTGDNTIPVVQGDILSYYRGSGQYPCILETGDLLKAADDWRNDIIPPGYSVPITTGQLLTLSDEWRRS